MNILRYADLEIRKELLEGGANILQLLAYVNNENYKYLQNGNIRFEFADKTINNKKIIDRIINNGKRSRDNEGYVETEITHYYASGNHQAVFIIKDLNTNENYVFKIRDMSMFDKNQLKRFLEISKNKYLKDIEYVKANIPILYYYGRIFKDGDTKNCIYNITKIYQTNFNVLDFNQKYIFFKKLLEALIHLQKYGFYLKDLKLENLGYDSGLNPIFIDYDLKTISNIETDTILGETFFPFYIMNEMSQKDWKVIRHLEDKNKQNKISVIGLCDVIFNLFYKEKNLILRFIYFGIKTHENITPDMEFVKLNFLPYQGDENVHFQAKQNISNLDLMKTIPEKIIPLYPEHPVFYQNLKTILFDSVNNLGLLHPQYERIYNLTNVYTILYGSELLSLRTPTTPQKSLSKEFPDTPPTVMVDSQTENVIENNIKSPIAKKIKFGGQRFKIVYKN